ncbi:MAG: RNA polymerase sigma factor RpoD/SigA [Calditrichaceae bacterium]|nr:RNA polymerase sigma factor RpoD/SigA [Calditrichaceae bacterium]MBN2709567.1 RNA polymerase sigma factor RpoD/SigA [Calditrichaceae bacterium]
MIINSKLDQYLKEIAEIPLLKPEEEVELARRIKQNDQQALQKLVSANLRFVVSVSKSYQNNGLSLEDLINEGNVGLIKAAYRFDETRGFKFISYAVWWIRQAILQAIAEQSRLIRLPLNRIGILTKIHKVQRSLEQEFDREPTLEEIASMMEINSEEIASSIKNSRRPVSMDSPLNTDSNNRIIDVLTNQQLPETDSVVMESSLKQDIREVLKKLTDREARILKLYYGLDGEKPHTLEEVGLVFKLTRERVRQIKEKALQKLRESHHSEALQIYLG